VNVEILLVDAGYSSKDNISQLIETNIPFLTRLCKNRKEYKALITEYGSDLKHLSNAVMYGERVLFAKKVEIEMYKQNLYAYIMLDEECQKNEVKKIVKNYLENPDDTVNASQKLECSGKFILISSLNINIDEVLPLYYQRQSIEQIFDISKTYANISTLRAHSEETVRGILLICFISTIIYSLISSKLAQSKYSALSALIKTHYLRIKIYENTTIVEELTKEQNEIFELMNITCPFMIENGTLLHKKPFFASLGSKKRSRGRPKGSGKKMPEATPQVGTSSHLAGTRRRGRPKGSKNKPVADSDDHHSTPTNLKRKRGRPKGSKNKPKLGIT
jgi:transposase